jgi:small subunit ribosomal protein S21
MLIVKLKEGDNIERALKKFKRKVNETKLIPQLREREKFTKSSVRRRETIKNATYVEKLRRYEDTF